MNYTGKIAKTNFINDTISKIKLEEDLIQYVSPCWIKSMLLVGENT